MDEKSVKVIVENMNEVLKRLNSNTVCTYEDELFLIKVKDRTPSFVAELNHYLNVRFGGVLKYSVMCQYSPEYLKRCNELLEELFPGMGFTFKQLTENDFPHSPWRAVGEAMGEDITMGH